MSVLESCLVRCDGGPDIEFTGRLVAKVEGWSAPNEWLVLTLFESDGSILVLESEVKSRPLDLDATFDVYFFASVEALLEFLGYDRVAKQLRETLGYPTTVKLSELKFNSEGVEPSQGLKGNKTRH